MIIQYIATSQNYLAIDKTLTELTSGTISVEDAVQALTHLSKKGKE